MSEGVSESSFGGIASVALRSRFGTRARVSDWTELKVTLTLVRLLQSSCQGEARCSFAELAEWCGVACLHWRSFLAILRLFWLWLWMESVCQRQYSNMHRDERVTHARVLRDCRSSPFARSHRLLRAIPANLAIWARSQRRSISEITRLMSLTLSDTTAIVVLRPS